MCGIWFSVGIERNPAYLETIAHRGPDGSGWLDFPSAAGPVALGHRRLAIIDTSDDALQPMSYAGGRYWIVFNGEIYNYRELREELAAKGLVCATQSDTEVLLAAYAAWGESCVDRLMGMFAFVIFDRQQEKLFAARDRFGIKPLYWVKVGRGLAFASEIKQLLQVPGVSRSGNLSRLYDFIQSGITDHTEETLFADIRQFRGGHALSLDLSSPVAAGPDLPIRRWYHLPKPGSLHMGAKAAATRFRELLTDSIRLHLRSDVTVGSCLSGGLDSSAIVSLAVRQLEAEGTEGSFNTVSACYAEARVDERPFIEAVVNASHTTPHYVYPRVEDVLAKAERITWHQDEPYGSTSIFAQWSVFERAREEGVKVMLDGQGADEQLAGYHGAFAYHAAALLKQGRLAELARLVVARHRHHGISVADQVRSLLAPHVPSALRLLRRRARAVCAQGGPDWLDSEAFRRLASHTGAFETALERDGLPLEGIGDLCVAMTQATNLPMLLHWEDRNSMAHGIEARVPFLDHRLVEFTIGLGDRHKIVGADTKSVLRNGMRGIMPDVICDRRDKLGFATPEQEWFRGPLREAIAAGVEDTLARMPGVLNPKGTRSLADDILGGRRQVDFTLWRIVNLGIWSRVFSVSV